MGEVPRRPHANREREAGGQSCGSPAAPGCPWALCPCSDTRRTVPEGVKNFRKMLSGYFPNPKRTKLEETV